MVDGYEQHRLDRPRRAAVPFHRRDEARVENAYARVTGEKQGGDAFDGVYWKYSQWKNWLRKNKSYMTRKFMKEKKEALAK